MGAGSGPLSPARVAMVALGCWDDDRLPSRCVANGVVVFRREVALAALLVGADVHHYRTPG